MPIPLIPSFALAAVLALALAAPVGATDGDFDPAFGNAGRALIDMGTGADAFGDSAQFLADGRMLITGMCMPPDDDFSTCVLRLQTDGSPDPTFGPAHDGRARLHELGLPLGFFPGRSLALPDGRLLLVYGSPVAQGMIAVLKADGSSLDPAVGDGDGFFLLLFNDNPTALQGAELQFSGPATRVLLYGQTHTGNSFDIGIARLTLAGLELDPSFGEAGIRTIGFDVGPADGSGSDSDFPGGLLQDAEGRILVYGGAVGTDFVTDQHAAAARLTRDGNLDPSFGPGGDGRLVLAPTGGFYGAALYPGGRIAVGGEQDGSAMVSRLLPDGAQDPSFNGGTALLLDDRFDAIGGLVARPDGGIVAAGNGMRPDREGGRFGVVRLQADASADAGFGTGGAVFGSFAPPPGDGFDDWETGLHLGNGGLWVSGTGLTSATGQYGVGVARLQFDPVFDSGFDITP